MLHLLFAPLQGRSIRDWFQFRYNSGQIGAGYGLLWRWSSFLQRGNICAAKSRECRWL